MLRRLLFLFLALFAIFWWFRRLLGGRRRTPPTQARPSTRPPEGGEMVRDRICNTFLPRSRALTLRVGSEQEFFCSEQCKQVFVSRNQARS